VRLGRRSLIHEFGALGPPSVAERLVAWEVVLDAGSLQLSPPLALVGHQPLHTLLLLLPRALPIRGLHCRSTSSVVSESKSHLNSTTGALHLVIRCRQCKACSTQSQEPTISTLRACSFVGGALYTLSLPIHIVGWTCDEPGENPNRGCITVGREHACTNAYKNAYIKEQRVKIRMQKEIITFSLGTMLHLINRSHISMLL
jgi:hypothetical protein